jgi:hypothetical protein
MKEVAKVNPEEQPIKPCRGYLWLGVVGILLVGMLYFYYYYPYRDLGLQQPIYFSHRVHAGVKEINCRFCHPFVERSPNAGLPAMEKCFFCHKYVIPDHPQIVKEREHYESKQPVPWKRVFWVPDFVYFNHIPHIKWAGLDCSECHGDVKAVDRLRPVKFKMGFCIGCHRKLGANLDCWLACHR